MKENTVKQKNITDEINIFFKNNIKIIVICSVIVLIINIVDIVTIKFGIDSEHTAILGTHEMFKLSGRFGLYILNILFKNYNFGFVGIDFIINDGHYILNEIEDLVGCRMLYLKWDKDIADLLFKEILKIIKQK